MIVCPGGFGFVGRNWHFSIRAWGEILRCEMLATGDRNTETSVLRGEQTRLSSPGRRGGRDGVERRASCHGADRDENSFTEELRELGDFGGERTMQCPMRGWGGSRYESSVE